MLVYQKIKKRISLSIVLLMLLCAALPGVAAANSIMEGTSVNYVALGNSLAAGQTPYPIWDNGVLIPTFDKGYPDFIAEKIANAGYLGFFEKRYAVSGYTTDNLLNDIINDVRRDIAGSPDSIGIRGNIAQADIVTIDIGSNDLFKEMVFSDTGVSFDPAKLPGILQKISENTGTILAEIRMLNPGARIYVMGYPVYPYLPPDQQAGMNLVTDLLNDTLETAAINAGAGFVPTASAIAANPTLYFPNPLDIHLSLEGYQIVAGEFLQLIEPQLPVIKAEKILKAISTADLTTAESVDEAFAALDEAKTLIHSLPEDEVRENLQKTYVDVKKLLHQADKELKAAKPVA